MNNCFVDMERGKRLKEQRLLFPKLSQVRAAEIAEVTENTWLRYEKRGEPFDLKVMQRLEEYGFDMMYVIFGVPKELKSEQIELLGLYERAPDSKKKKLLEMIELFIDQN